MYSTLVAAVWNFEVAQESVKSGLVWRQFDQSQFHFSTVEWRQFRCFQVTAGAGGELLTTHTNPHTHCGSSHVQIRDKRRLVSHKLIGVAVTVVNP